MYSGFIMMAIKLLTDLSKDFDKSKVEGFITQLKTGSPEDIKSMTEALKPLAGGKLAPVIDQLMTKISPENIQSLQRVISQVTTGDLTKLAANFLPKDAAGLMGKAKDLLGGFFKS
jgi:hypothetical protein